MALTADNSINDGNNSFISVRLMNQKRKRNQKRAGITTVM